MQRRDAEVVAILALHKYIAQQNIIAVPDASTSNWTNRLND
jgi:hypothetical protein